jgi:hypothetical protein
VDVHQHGSAACKNNLALSARLKHRRLDSGIITIHHQYGSVKRTMDARSAAANERKFFCVGLKREDRLDKLHCANAGAARKHSLNPEPNLAVRRFHRT